MPLGHCKYKVIPNIPSHASICPHPQLSKNTLCLWYGVILITWMQQIIFKLLSALWSTRSYLNLPTILLLQISARWKHFLTKWVEYSGIAKQGTIGSHSFQRLRDCSHKTAKVDKKYTWGEGFVKSTCFWTTLTKRLRAVNPKDKTLFIPQVHWCASYLPYGFSTLKMMGNNSYAYRKSLV